MIDPLTFSRTPRARRAGAWFIVGDRDAAFVPANLTGFASKCELLIVREYACPDTLDGRKSTRLQVIQDLECGNISALIAADLTVIAQGNSDLLDITNALARSDGRLILCDDDIDTDRSGAPAFAAAILATAAWRRSIDDTTALSPLQSHTIAHVRIRTPAPFGYWWSEGRLEPHPREAPIRAEVYTLFVTLPDLAKVASTLKARGRRLRQRKRFTPADVRRILQDPVSIGVYRGNRKPEYDPAIDGLSVASVPVQPLVSESLWKECNARLGLLRITADS